MEPPTDSPSNDPDLLRPEPRLVWAGFGFFGAVGAVGILGWLPGVLAFGFQGWLLNRGGLGRSHWRLRMIVANLVSTVGSIPLLIKWPAPSFVGVPLAIVIALIYAAGPAAPSRISG